MTDPQSQLPAPKPDPALPSSDDPALPAGAQTLQPLDVESLNATQSLVQRLADQMDEISLKQKELNTMLKNIFDNDTTLAEAKNAAKEAANAVKTRQADLNNSQEVKEVKLKLSETKEDLAMIQDSLNVHLVNYYQMTGATSFPTSDGGEREFSLLAKLKGKKA